MKGAFIFIKNLFIEAEQRKHSAVCVVTTSYRRTGTTAGVLSFLQTQEGS
jgi:hypothetical protein